MLNFSFCEPKAAASRESTRLSVSDIPSVHSLCKSVVYAFILAFVSILNSVIGERSMTVYHTKEDEEHQLVPHSGIDKDFRRRKVEKSRNSKKFDHEKYKSDKSGKTWDPDFRRKQLRLNAERNSKKTKHHGFAPHSGVESLTLEFLKAQAGLMGKTLPEDIWSKVEGVTLLAAALTECHSDSQALSIIGLYLKTHIHNKSLIEYAADVIKSLMEVDETSEELEPHVGLEKPDWLVLLRGGLTNWRLISSNPVFKKVSYLISVLITLGVCDAGNFEWKIGQVKAFSIGALERHTGAIDLLDAAIETIVYFVEGGYACFTTGSMTPLFYSDMQAVEFDEEYSFLVSNLEHVKTGNLKKIRRCY